MYSICPVLAIWPKQQIIITYYQGFENLKREVIHTKHTLFTNGCSKIILVCYVDNIFAVTCCGGAKGLCILNLSLCQYIESEC